MLAYDSKKSGHVVAPFVTNKFYHLILIKTFRKRVLTLLTHLISN